MKSKRGLKGRKRTMKQRGGFFNTIREFIIWVASFISRMRGFNQEQTEMLSKSALSNKNVVSSAEIGDVNSVVDEILLIAENSYYIHKQFFNISSSLRDETINTIWPFLSVARTFINNKPSKYYLKIKNIWVYLGKIDNIYINFDGEGTPLLISSLNKMNHKILFPISTIENKSFEKIVNQETFDNLPEDKKVINASTLNRIIQERMNKE